MNPYLSLLLNDDTGSFWDREGQERSLGGSQNEVSVSLNHRSQVLPLWLAAVVHQYLIWWHQMCLMQDSEENYKVFK